MVMAKEWNERMSKRECTLEEQGRWKLSEDDAVVMVAMAFFTI